MNRQVLLLARVQKQNDPHDSALSGCLVDNCNVGTRNALNGVHVTTEIYTLIRDDFLGYY